MPEADNTTSAQTGPTTAPGRRRGRGLVWPALALALLWAFIGPLPTDWRMAVVVERITVMESPTAGGASPPKELAGFGMIKQQRGKATVADLPTREVVLRIRPRFGRLLPGYDDIEVLWQKPDGSDVTPLVHALFRGERLADRNMGAGERARYAAQAASEGLGRRVRAWVWPPPGGVAPPGRRRAREIVLIVRLQVPRGVRDVRVTVRFLGSPATGPSPRILPAPPPSVPGGRVIAQVTTPVFRLLERRSTRARTKSSSLSPRRAGDTEPAPADETSGLPAAD